MRCVFCACVRLARVALCRKDLLRRVAVRSRRKIGRTSLCTCTYGGQGRKRVGGRKCRFALGMPGRREMERCGGDGVGWGMGCKGGQGAAGWKERSFSLVSRGLCALTMNGLGILALGWRACSVSAGDG
ncbi:hypothetical protein BD311DRAFT_765764 [Dichomitus squalens]|uniref:Uncharacterized protein n=1 Tax=Dichomitus squalens TaxID=114155 RepID=A0A4Q9MEA5_9APHY|nr:hypothetical protein BD311DRAFT_765764 [Dichomitus squalens]